MTNNPACVLYPETAVSLLEAGNLNTIIRVRPYRALIITVWTVTLFFVAAAVAFPVILAQPWLEMIMGRRPVNLFVLVAVPPLCAFTAYVAYRFVRRAPGALQPDIYTEEGFSIMGESYSWDMVDRVFLNPRLKYVTILYKKLTPGMTAGTTLDKNRFEPSFAAFLTVLRSQKVFLEEFNQFGAAELNNLRYKWMKEVRS